MKTYIEEIMDEASTNQDIYTNYKVLLAEELVRAMREGDDEALAMEIADILVNDNYRKVR